MKCNEIGEGKSGAINPLFNQHVFEHQKCRIGSLEKAFELNELPYTIVLIKLTL